MSAANGTQRDIGLDLTRILAFLAVPSVHFFLNSTYYDTAIVGPRMALMTVMRTAFMVCVPLYMLLSGYLSAEKHIPLTRPGLLGYYKKLLPIFLTYALSTGVILLYRALWLGEEQTILSAVKNLLSFQQSCLSLATSIPTQIMKIPPVCLLDAGSTGLFTLVTLFHINRLAVSN